MVGEPFDRAVLDAAPIPTVVIRDGRLVYVNPAAAALLQTSPEQLIGRAYSELLAPDDVERVADRQARRLRGEPVPTMYEATLRSGAARRSVQLHVTAAGDAVVAQILDVTDELLRRQRLSAIAELGALVQRERREEEVRRLVRDALVALDLELVVLRPDGDGLRVVSADLAGGRAALFQAASGVRLAGWVHPWTPALRRAWASGAAFVDDLLEEVRSLLPDGLPPEEVARAADSATVVVRVELDQIPDTLLLVTGDWLRAGDLPAFRLLGSQISAAVDAARLLADTRRRAEELQLLLEVGRSLVETLDLDQVLDLGIRNLARIVDAPEGMLALQDPTGTQLVIRASTYTHPELLGRTLPLGGRPSVASSVFTERVPLVIEDAAGDPRVDRQLQAASQARAYLALPLVVRDRAIGAAVIVETRGPRAFTPAEVDRAAAIANQLAVAVENARLYADLRRSYADLARAQDQLVRQERLAALGELAAVVAHEVRNPLGVIFNSLGSLRRLVKPHGDAGMLLDMVSEEADRLNRIVGDLLDFARPSPASPRPQPLDRVVDEAVGAALSVVGGRIAVVRDVPADLPPVPMDAYLVRQALVNVAMNAVQAMPGHGTLTVRVRFRDGAAVVEIGDTGPGIPAEVRPRIFEPFFTTRATGTGLGLAVVKRIVEDHRGRVEVRGLEEGGTVFALHLPLAAPARPDPS
jgi:PAS domain S-box-containing protein